MSMTWWSEHSAVPRFVFAKSAIRCRFVDRFVGSRVPSHVSGQQFSTHGASLPSAGSRRARFPDFTSTMRALRRPVRHTRSLMASVPGPTAPSVFVLATGAPDRAEVPIGPGVFGQPVSPLRRLASGHAQDLSGFLAVHPIPLPCSKTPAGPTGPRHSRSLRCCPRIQQAEGSSVFMISRLTQGFSICCLRFTSVVAATHARLASGWRAAPLPGGS